MPDLISEEVKEKCKEFMMPPSPMSGDNSVDSKRPPPPPAGQQTDGTRQRRPHGPPMHSVSILLNLLYSKKYIVGNSD